MTAINEVPIKELSEVEMDQVSGGQVEIIPIGGPGQFVKFGEGSEVVKIDTKDSVTAIRKPDGETTIFPGP